MGGAQGRISGNKVTVSGTASIITKLQVLKIVNGVLKWKWTGSWSPYTYSWKVPAGSGVTYQLKAKARDAAGNVGVSNPVTVTAKQ